MTDSDRLANLRLAQAQIVSRLDDQKTPAYSIAPLTNQLRLVEKEISRLTDGEDQDLSGLPSSEEFCLIDAFTYQYWLEGPRVPSTRRPPNEWVKRQEEIFQSWKAAGFELSPRPETGGLSGWVKQNREALLQCLATEGKE